MVGLEEESNPASKLAQSKQKLCFLLALDLRAHSSATPPIAIQLIRMLPRSMGKTMPEARAAAVSRDDELRRGKQSLSERQLGAHRESVERDVERASVVIQSLYFVPSSASRLEPLRSSYDTRLLSCVVPCLTRAIFRRAVDRSWHPTDVFLSTKSASAARYLPLTRR